MSTDGRIYSWNEEVIKNPDENEYIELPPGEYHFRVTKFERSQHEGSAKLPPCPKAVITCLIEDRDLGEVTVRTNLFLHEKCNGLLSQFFCSIGLHKHGEPLVLAWSKIIGKKGRCRIGQREYQGKRYNEIVRFLEPAATPATPSQSSGKPDQIPFDDQF